MEQHLSHAVGFFCLGKNIFPTLHPGACGAFANEWVKHVLVLLFYFRNFDVYY